MRWLGFFYVFCIVTNFINCLLILIRIYVLAIVGSDTFVISFVLHVLAILAISKAIQYTYIDFCISCFVPSPCVIVFCLQLNN